MNAVKLNTTAVNNYSKRPFRIILFLRSFFCVFNFLFIKLRNNLFGYSSNCKHINKTSFRPVADIEERKTNIYDFNKIKKNRKKHKRIKTSKRYKKSHLKFKLPSIGLPSINFPKINWDVFIPFLKIVFKYLFILSLCFSIVFGFLWLFTSEILDILKTEQDLTRKKVIRSIVLEEVTPERARVESFSNRLIEVEEALNLKKNPQLKPKKKKKRKYRVMNSKKVKYIIR